MKDNLSMPAMAWLLLTVACTTLIIVGLKAVLKKTGWEKNRQQRIVTVTAVVLSAWTVLLLVLSSKNFFSDFSQLPPRPGLAMLVPLPVILGIAFSKAGSRLLQVVPPHWLVLLQSFRIAVELLLLGAFINEKLPVQMTFEGRNFDVVTGLLALPVGYLMAKGRISRKFAIVFNIIGLVLLLNILVIAVLSMPTPIRYFMNEPANTLVGQFPFILLPGVLVPIAYGLHIFSLRQLLIQRAADTKAQGLNKPVHASAVS
jgi:hypothetical protein